MSGGSLGAEIVQERRPNVWSRRPHTIFSLLLRNLGTQTSSGHNFCTILVFRMFRAVPEDGLATGPPDPILGSVPGRCRVGREIVEFGI